MARQSKQLPTPRPISLTIYLAPLGESQNSALT
jgi:hypothetical protein